MQPRLQIVTPDFARHPLDAEGLRSRVDKVLESVERMMARREQFLRAGMRAQLERAHAQRWSADS